ncbi:MAG TPA: DMT family transporter [Micropepsaceae bacterium]|jgi:drug/metabolite transporter (DMT)-like permease|nr:DMT family transporter [Micropepsaceae bacterium]
MTEGVTRAARNVFLASENLRGIMLMIVARLVFAGSDTFTKLASAGLPASEVVVLRNAVSLPIVMVLAWRLGGLRHFSAFRDRTVVTRSVLEGTGTLAFVAALPFVMLGQSTVILLTVPIILVALSAMIYREAVGWRRWTAIVIGFIGVILVAGPLSGRPSYYLLLTQFTAVAWAFRDLMTSRIVGRIPTATVSLVNTVVVGCLAVPGFLFQHWHGFGMQEMLYLLGSGGLVAFSNFLYIDALRTGAIAVVAPFRYSAALWATIAGFLVWGDVPDMFGVIGTLFIIGSGLYTFYRELELVKARRLQSQLSSPASPA